ncbi:MAG TPA: aminoglycoside phosphotransferase family protein [Flavisolibacter sp.]|jgi:Ser/Thr protein kinase RdoA (MazF antagonist)|nr:aminoglycoside phosphotransferase family protein [Flavisolibacter sp.]
MLTSILSQYGLDEKHCTVQPFGSGLINHTWKVNHTKGSYILQRINHHVFKQPFHIAENLRLISNYLKQYHPEYLFTTPLTTAQNEDIVYDEEQGYFRLFHFIPASHTVDVVDTPQQAFEAAKQFGKFTQLLSGLDINALKITLPDFHNLSLRYQQFEQAISEGNKERIAASLDAITFLQQHIAIVETYEAIKQNPDFRLRVTHHDTKISNILLDEKEKGLCVIDLDTVMPGYFISDVGDMMRTYLSPVSEEEKDFSKIEIREEYFKAIVDGYLQEMNEELSATEQMHFVFAGKFIIYMQALRFLTDYLNNDIYYGAKYPEHNFVRAGNQIVLLQRLLEKEETLQGLTLVKEDPLLQLQNLS